MAESSKLHNVIESSFDSQSPRATANRAALQELLATIRDQEEKIRLGGGAKAAAAQHAKRRLTVRERLKLLLDPETEFLELGSLGRLRNVCRIRRRARSRRCHWAGPRLRTALHDHRQ